MKINDLFFELSHEGRYKIFMSIVQERKKHSYIENELSLTGPEVSRHLKRLTEEKLIEKTVDGYYQVTPFGRIISIGIPFFENSIEFVDFINSHNFESIPADIFLQIGSLKDLELRTTTMENIELWSSLITNSQQYIYAITDQLQKSAIPIIQKKVQAGIGLDLKAIIDRKLFEKFMKLENLPADANQLLKQMDIFNNVRIAEELNVSLIITELGAMIFLKSGKTFDYSQCIFSKSKGFLNWIQRLFNLFWKNATVIKSSDLVLKKN